MERCGVVDLGGNPALAEKISQLIALGAADDELIVHVLISGRFQWRPHQGFKAALRKQFPVTDGPGAALDSPTVEVPQLHPQYGSRDLIQPAVEAQCFIVIPARTAVLAQQPDSLRQSGVASRNQAAVTDSSQVLGRKKAEASSGAKTTYPGSLV